MSKTIIVGGTVIDFPESGTSPDWAEAVDQFAVATADALSASFGPYDVAPQVMIIDGSTYNPTVSPVDIPNLSFSSIVVRSLEVKIAVHRTVITQTVPTTITNSISETNTLLIVYNENNPSNSKWEISRESVGDASITFNMTDVGQIQFQTSTLSGTNHTGIISYSAKALLNS